MSSTPEDDAAWKAIVQNYGTAPEFPSADPEPAAAEPAVSAAPEGPVLPAELADSPADHYVPPPAPAAPVPQGPRGFAWVGVLGVPALTLLLIALPGNVPGWLAFLLLAWFAGGFLYLVATMNHSSDDGWDDGAVV